jgi:polynucleotide 5'-kinase involved in rRNA processing
MIEIYLGHCRAPKNLLGVSLVKSFSRSRVVIYVRVRHEPSDSLVRFQDVQVSGFL